MVTDIKLLSFSSAKEGIVYWNRTFTRERRLLQISPTRGGRWTLVRGGVHETKGTINFIFEISNRH